MKSAQAFRTISEVSEELNVQQHVLRFWETKFAQVKPLKRGGGRRYYRPDDIDLLRAIKSLLYDRGYTIKGVQKIMKETGPRRLINEVVGSGETNGHAVSNGIDVVASPGSGQAAGPADSSLIAELEEIRDLLRET